jgi:hypothetical protein
LVDGGCSCSIHLSDSVARTRRSGVSEFSCKRRSPQAAAAAGWVGRQQTVGGPSSVGWTWTTRQNAWI